MALFGSAIFGFGLMLATALSVSMLPASGHAYTPEQEQACTSDAFRLCSSEIPNVERVTACMVAKKSQLSPPCRAQFRGPEPREAASGPAGKPMAIRPAAPRKSAAKARKPGRPRPSTGRTRLDRCNRRARGKRHFKPPSRDRLTPCGADHTSTSLSAQGEIN